MRRRRATVATSGEWQCKTGGVRRLAVANGPNIFQMLLVFFYLWCTLVMGQVTNFTTVGGTAKHGVAQYMVSFRYCSLVVDTVMSSGLHARLCYS